MYSVRSRQKRLPWFVGLLSLAALASCSSAIAPTAESLDQAVSVAESAPAGDTSAQNLLDTPRSPQRPQLIKRAFLQIELDDIGDAITNIEALLGQYQGDLLTLSDQENEYGSPRRVQVELRVPQGNLSALLDELREVGTVVEQSITAEDVSNQLVDLSARVRNLRKSEEALLEIMERSGSVADVLEVARELSNVRETIERADAQLSNLQNQVAYSTISLLLVSTQATAPDAAPIGETLGATWQSASSALRSVSVGLLRILLWLLVFSPYLAMLLLLGWGGRWYWLRQQQAEES